MSDARRKGKKKRKVEPLIRPSLLHTLTERTVIYSGPFINSLCMSCANAMRKYSKEHYKQRKSILVLLSKTRGVIDTQKADVSAM